VFAILNVFDRVVVPRTVRVPSVSIAVEVINVLTVVLPTLILAVVKLTFAPTLIVDEALAVGVLILPDAVVRPVMPSVLRAFAAPETPNVLNALAAPETPNVLNVLAAPVTERVFDKTVAPTTVSVPSVSIAVEVRNVLTVVLPTVILAVVRFTFAPTLIVDEALAVGVLILPEAVVRPVIFNVFDNVAAPSTVSVPSVSIAVEVINVLTVVLPTLILAAVRFTFAPTFTADDALAVGVLRLPEAVVSPVTVNVFDNVAAPVTAIVFAKLAFETTFAAPLIVR